LFARRSTALCLFQSTESKVWAINSILKHPNLDNEESGVDEDGVDTSPIDGIDDDDGFEVANKSPFGTLSPQPQLPSARIVLRHSPPLTPGSEVDEEMPKRASPSVCAAAARRTRSILPAVPSQNHSLDTQRSVSRRPAASLPAPPQPPSPSPAQSTSGVPSAPAAPLATDGVDPLFSFVQGEDDHAEHSIEGADGGRNGGVGSGGVTGDGIALRGQGGVGPPSPQPAAAVAAASTVASPMAVTASASGDATAVAALPLAPPAPVVPSPAASGYPRTDGNPPALPGAVPLLAAPTAGVDASQYEALQARLRESEGLSDALLSRPIANSFLPPVPFSLCLCLRTLHTQINACA